MQKTFSEVLKTWYFPCSAHFDWQAKGKGGGYSPPGYATDLDLHSVQLRFKALFKPLHFAVMTLQSSKSYSAIATTKIQKSWML